MAPSRIAAGRLRYGIPEALGPQRDPADPRRRVLKLIAERPRTTQELAPLVGLSITGLSKCLRRLAEAGLVSARRDGYYVVYRFEPARLEAIPDAIRDFLGRGAQRSPGVP